MSVIRYSAVLLSGLLFAGLVSATFSSCKPSESSGSGQNLPIAITPCQQTWRDYQQTHKTIMDKISAKMDSDVQAETQKMQSLIPALQSCAASGQISQADIDAVDQQGKAAATRIQSQMQSQVQEMTEKAQKEAGEMNEELQKAKSGIDQAASDSQDTSDGSSQQ